MAFSPDLGFSNATVLAGKLFRPRVCIETPTDLYEAEKPLFGRTVRGLLNIMEGRAFPSYFIGESVRSGRSYENLCAHLDWLF